MHKREISIWQQRNPRAYARLTTTRGYFLNSLFYLLALCFVLLFLPAHERSGTDSLPGLIRGFFVISAFSLLMPAIEIALVAGWIGLVKRIRRMLRKRV